MKDHLDAIKAIIKKAQILAPPDVLNQLAEAVRDGIRDAALEEAAVRCERYIGLDWLADEIRKMKAPR